MSNEPSRRQIVGQEFQDIAHTVDAFTLTFLRGMHNRIGTAHDSQDAGPLLTGALTAVIRFMMEAEHDENRVRESFETVLANMPAQIAMDLVAEKAGARKAGQA